MFGWPGCCCQDDTPVSLSPSCPCPDLPSTLYLTFSRQVNGIYKDATLVYGPPPTGWTAAWGSFTTFWSNETWTDTYASSTFGSLTATWKYVFNCSISGGDYVQRVARYSIDGDVLGAVETYLRKSIATGVVSANSGTFDCEPFFHADTFTNGVYFNSGEVPCYNGCSGVVLSPAVGFLLSA